MKIQVLNSPLDKGESWEIENSREIEITETTDNRGASPLVYFSISKLVGKKQKQVIVQDIFLPTDQAILIGKELIKQAKSIDKIVLQSISKTEKIHKAVTKIIKTGITKERKPLKVNDVVLSNKDIQNINSEIKKIEQKNSPIKSVSVTRTNYVGGVKKSEKTTKRPLSKKEIDAVSSILDRRVKIKK